MNPLRANVERELTRRFILSRGLGALAFVFAVVWMPVSVWAGPPEDVLRLLPDDAGFVFFVKDLRGTVQRVAQSPFARKLQGRGKGEVPAALKAVREFDRQIKESLGLSSQQILDDVLGDMVAVAYRPGPPGKPELDDGLVVISVRNNVNVADFVARLAAVQKSLGEIKDVQPRVHSQKKYMHWKKNNVEDDEFVYWSDGILAFSPNEALIKSVIEKIDSRPQQKYSHRFQSLGLDRAVAGWWINPRAFDSAVEQQALQAQPDHAAAARLFSQSWQAVDSLALFLELDADIRIGVAWKADAAKLPPAIRKLSSAWGQQSTLAGAAPADAILALNGRIDLAALIDLGKEILPQDEQRNIREGFSRTIGAAFGDQLPDNWPSLLGPDWAAWIRPGDSGEIAPHAVLAVRLQNELASTQFAGRLTDVAHLAMSLFAAGQNRNQKAPNLMAVRSDSKGGVDIRYLVDEVTFPRGFQPALAVKDGCLLVASSPSAIRSFEPGSPPQPSLEASRLSLHANRLFDWLEKNRKPIADQIVKWNGRESAAIEVELAAVREALIELTSANLVLGGDAGQNRLELKISLSDALAGESTKKPR